jgi:hypothetical protein
VQEVKAQVEILDTLADGLMVFWNGRAIQRGKEPAGQPPLLA